MVVVDPLGERVVFLGELVELRRGAGELLGVVGEVALDAAELDARDGAGRLHRSGGRAGLVRVVAAAAREGQDEQQRWNQEERTAHVRRTLHTLAGRWNRYCVMCRQRLSSIRQTGWNVIEPLKSRAPAQKTRAPCSVS